MRLGLVWVLAVWLGACGAENNPRKSISESSSRSPSASADAHSAFHSLTGWQQKVGFYIEDGAPDLLVESAITAAASWNDAVGREALEFAGVAQLSRGEALYSSLDDSLTVLYYEKRWRQTTGKPNSTLATTVWENALDSDRIVKGDIILNAESYHFLDAHAPAPVGVAPERMVDAETVLLHEFGHLLGLDHVEMDDDPLSVMHAKTFIGPHMTSRTLSSGDVENLRSLYD